MDYLSRKRKQIAQRVYQGLKSRQGVIPSAARNPLFVRVTRNSPMKRYWVYILANKSRTLYTGVTNDLMRRVAEHRSGTGSKFTSRYRITRLVYCENTPDVREAIAREKQIKGWDRQKKIDLIESRNPPWEDLAREWSRAADSSQLRSE